MSTTHLPHPSDHVGRHLGRSRWARRVALVAALPLLLAACAGDSGATDAPSGAAPNGSAPGPPSDTEVSGEVVVFAAASLTESFTELGEDFQAAHPQATVTFNFAGSSALAQQIISGAPVDVFAAASPATMAQVTENGDAAGEPAVFVRNRLEIAVPAGNPGDVTELADFADEDRTIALCAEEVPCGAAALTAFEAAGITPAPDTLESDVKAALTKVELGEVDAALVYRTDVIAAGDTVEGIDFPEAEEAINDYPMVVLADSPNPETAAAFVELVRSDEGQQVLTDAGFSQP